MAEGQVVFNLDQLDDPVLPDGVPSFDGGHFSNWRANLLKPNQSKRLVNCDVDKLGKLRTRRGSERIGNVIAAGAPIQGLTALQNKDFNYIVAACNGKIWAFQGGSWIQIATGGTADNEDILIARQGTINYPIVPGPPQTGGVYDIGTTVLTVDAMTGIVAPGEKLYFANNRKTDPWEYVIKAFDGVAHTITLEEPGLVFKVWDNWTYFVMRPAKVNNPGGYPAGTLTIAIDGYLGAVNTGEYFVIKSENINHKITAHTEGSGNTITLTTDTGLQADYVSTNLTDPVCFAQGNDQIFFCDGIGPIYGWNGKTLMKISQNSLLDFLSAVTLPDRTKPPDTCTILVWWQNRLIASGIPNEPDAIYYSDAMDPTSWDRDFQQQRIGGGDSDPITNLIPWTDYNIICYKKNSVTVIDTDPSQNPDPTDPTLLVASFAVKRIHRHLGCPAPLTAVQVGGGSSSPGSDVFFLDFDRKVRSIRRVLAAESQQEIGDAISLPIQDVFDRITLAYIDRCVSWYHNDHYLIALPVDGAQRPTKVCAYHLLTQSWCGEWDGWFPTCFSLRQDVGESSKMIFGQWGGATIVDTGPGAGTIVDAGTGGTVYQWLDDVSLPDEVTATYEDQAIKIPTSILTRAITFGDPFNYKTGLAAEFEFDESIAGGVVVQVILDDVPQVPIIAPAFSTLSGTLLHLPVIIPFTLPAPPKLKRFGFDLQRYGTWRELQFLITSPAGKLSIRSIRVTGFMDTIKLQTLPEAAITA